MQATAEKLSPAANLNWWRGGVIYQIYPRSFQDSTGDGIGDLNGIAARLPYVASLGVDAIWISPFFTSPMKDFGYDVSDYRDVDPMFGTLDDFDRLVETAHRLGVRVMIDLVLSHSSDQHPWFQESRRDRVNDKADWYIWADPQPDGTPPNNWLSIFGGSAWHWDARREQYYLHNFLTSQPDLNFHQDEVQTALLDVTRFWLDRGVDGFRLDTINFYFADKDLRSNPALPPERRNAKIAPSVNPYNHQEHLYSKNRPENLVFLKRFRDLLDEYPGTAAVGEVGDAQLGMELLGQYTRDGQGVHMCYAFDFLAGDLLAADRVVEVFAKLEAEAPDGWACWALSNHDVTRHVSRWGLSAQGARCYATLLHMLRGSVCLYQGEELGLNEANVEFEDLQDPYGKEFWPEYKGRDGCRTPMVWEASNQNGGFSKAKPWLPVASEHLGNAVALQEGREDAMLHHYRHVILLRSGSEALRRGEQRNLTASGDLLTFLRTHGEERYFCAFNLGEGTVSVHMPEGDWVLVDKIGGTDPGAASGAGGMCLGPWHYTVLRAR
ncbi:MAG: alpha-glucosidase [Pseudomonadota bacterium]